MDYSSPPAAPRKDDESTELGLRKDARGDRVRINPAVDIAAESDAEGGRAKARAAWVAVGACLLLLLLGLGGAALLVWWALAFHRSNRQLWMVPVSLVLLGTPVVTWLSVFTSATCRRFELMRSVTAQPDVELGR
ncbi:uncharacterized protein LOC109707917 [Ananas comosus]|uniref:Uncharacterized protein LOC109707917 n=1 Tax=Ananas comosus TaxID=4615 RepID=A0A6P5ENJ8_ANACO|nr:uncharacterized protein LOC109707917 [Ananas comosus]